MKDTLILGEIEYWGVPGETNTLGNGEDLYGSTKYYKLTLNEELLKDGVKEIFSTSSNVYYLSNSGKVYVSGSLSSSGTGSKAGTSDGIIYSGLSNIETLYSTDMVKMAVYSDLCDTALCFTGKDGKIYTVGNQTIVFRDEVLEKKWVKIASNVLYFDGTGAGYVDRDNNLWIAGSDSRTLGLGTESETSQEISNYILHPDTNLQGKVAEVTFSTGLTYILTIDDELLGAGLYSSNGSVLYPGWEGSENKTEFTLIMENVKYFTSSNSSRYDVKICVTTENKMYGWGKNYGGTNGQSGMEESVPIEYSLPNGIDSYSEIYKLKSYDWQRSFLISTSGTLYLSGTWNNVAYDGGHTSTKYFSAYTNDIWSVDGSVVSSMVGMSGASSIVLTSSGKVYGWGYGQYLGIGVDDSTLYETLDLGLENISQIAGGNGWYVAVKTDGTVWGTGTNSYGVLGRWIGIDRSQPNSRYKTAYDWVECPDLEI